MLDNRVPDSSLDRLEGDVFARIAAHRQSQIATGALPVGLVVTITALAAGLVMGLLQSQRQIAARGSETAVLADDANLAPSALLASNQ